MHAACAAGAGIAVLMRPVADADPRCARVPPRLEAPPDEPWAVTHPDLRSAARVAAALRWIEGLGHGVAVTAPRAGRGAGGDERRQLALEEPLAPEVHLDEPPQVRRAMLRRRGRARITATE